MQLTPSLALPLLGEGIMGSVSLILKPVILSIAKNPVIVQKSWVLR